MHTRSKLGLSLTWLLGLAGLLAACGPAPSLEVTNELTREVTREVTRGATGDDRVPIEPTATEEYSDLRIVTLLPRDAIPAIDDPEFLTVEEANEVYEDDELVMGVAFNGDARAYSIPLLSSHEIVNDTVGGVKIAVTW